MQKETLAWIKKAEADWFGARQLDAEKHRVNDVICFHCQQTMEKYLKALLQEIGEPVPRTHDLEKLLDLLLPHDSTLRGLRRSLTSLSQYAVDFRYPDMSSTTRQSKSALRATERIREKLRLRLGLPN